MVMNCIGVTEKKLHKIDVVAGGSNVKYSPLFTYDSKYLLVPSGNEVKIVNIQSGECLGHLRGHSSYVVSIQINPLNHMQVLTCSEDGTIIQWDYQDSIVIKKFDMNLGSVAAFYAPSTNNTWYAIVGRKNKDFELLALQARLKGIAKKFVLKPVLPYQNCISFGMKGELVSGIYKNELRVLHLTTNIFKIHKTGTRNLTCIACHPVDCTVATGDDSGRILLWSGMLENNHPARSIYHWHTLPVADLVFSTEGAYLLSGGGESVLVKWKLGSEKRHFLPRMGLPLISLTSSPDNKYVATCHVDNAIHIVNAQNKVVKIYQGLTHGHQQKMCETENIKNLLPTGIIYDPRTKALVMNGKPGHLQFYNLHQDKLLFNLDIVGHNYLCQERSHAAVNIDVDKAAIDYKGLWMATVECRKDCDQDPEIILKFWNFDLTSQMFVLNTRVYLPHSKKVNAIKFQPFPVSSKNQHDHLAVTTSDDKRFKTWTLLSSSHPLERKSWNCESMGYYKDLAARDANFSEDGSLLAVTFAHNITLWTPETNTFKAAICHPTSKDTIQQAIFGREACAHLIVSCSESSLNVWNVLTLSVTWTISLGIEYLVSDPETSVMAIFTKDKDLFVFDPSNPKPLYMHKAVCQTAIISAVFIPKSRSENSKSSASHLFNHHSQLFFMNKNQTLLTVTDEVNSVELVKTVNTEECNTATLIKTFINKDKGCMVDKRHYLNPLKSNLYEKEIKMMPSHISLSVNMMCSKFLSSFLTQKEKFIH